MRARTSRRTALLATAAILGASALVNTGAGAQHPFPPNADRQWISQAGNGHALSDSLHEPMGLPILEDLNVQTVLFHAKNFPFEHGAVRLGFGRYVAWGLVRVQPPVLNTVVSQLAISHSDNGLDWSEPRPATIRDPKCDSAIDVPCPDIPFILNEPDGFFDVVFTPSPTDSAGNTRFPAAQFQIFYRAYDPDGGPGTNISDIHVAWSDEGQTWYGDRPLGGPPSGQEPVIGGTGFKSASFGPTQVLYQPFASTSSNCATVATPLGPTPWNCRLVMLYDAVDPAGNRRVGIAGAPNIVPPYTQALTAYNFVGRDTPLLDVGAGGAWDDRAATNAKVRVRPSVASPLNASRLYDLYYSGATGDDDACFAGTTNCSSLGTAISSGAGLVYTKTVGNPVTPRELLENPAWGFDAPHTLLAPSVLEDSGQDGNGSDHSRIYYTRATNGDGDDLDSVSRDMYLAYTEPAPTQAPRIRISSPQGPFRNIPGTPIHFFMTDTLGAPGLIGVDLETLVIRLNGIDITAGVTFPNNPTLVTALKHPAVEAFRPSGLSVLPDGLHTLEIEVADLEGNVGFASEVFILDTSPPATTIETHPDDGHIGFPINSPGAFTGETVEPPTGTDLVFLDVFVTNPLGFTQMYPVKIQPHMIVSSKEWHWRWVAPTPDLHFALPGFYTFSFLAQDAAQNREEPNEDNTVTVLIL